MTTRKRKGIRAKRHSAKRFLDDLIGDPMTFADTLRTVRECDEISQAEVARRLGISRAHVCDIEKGRKLVSPERAAKFAKALGHSPQQFVRLALQDQIHAAGLAMKVTVEAA